MEPFTIYHITTAGQSSDRYISSSASRVSLTLAAGTPTYMRVRLSGTDGFPAQCEAIVRKTKPRPTLSSRVVARQVAPGEHVFHNACFRGW